MIRIHFAWLTAALLTVLPFAAGAQSATAASANVLSGDKVTAVPFRARNRQIVSSTDCISSPVRY